MFGFSSQLNDFNINDMEKQLAQFQEVLDNPQEVELPEPVQYDPEGLDAIFRELSGEIFVIWTTH